MTCGHKNNLFNQAILPPLQTIPVEPKIMWRVHLDLATNFPLSTKGNKHVVIAICAFIKFIEAQRNLLSYFIIAKSFEISLLFYILGV